MTKANPNICPHCGSSNSGANFGFNPQRINNDETLIHDCLSAAPTVAASGPLSAS